MIESGDSMLCTRDFKVYYKTFTVGSYYKIYAIYRPLSSKDKRKELKYHMYIDNDSDTKCTGFSEIELNTHFEKDLRVERFDYAMKCIM